MLTKPRLIFLLLLYLINVQSLVVQWTLAADSDFGKHLEFDKLRMDGIVTIVPSFDSERVQTKLSFREHFDHEKQRSVTSLSKISTEPTEYHYHQDVDGLLFSKSVGECSVVETKSNSSFALAPEIRESVASLLPGVNIGELLTEASRRYAVGPSGLLYALKKFISKLDPNKTKKSSITGKTRRELNCEVHNLRFNLNANSDIEITTFMPALAQFRYRPDIAVAFVIRRLDLQDDLAEENVKETFEIDLMDIEMDKEIVDPIKRDSLFNLPLDSGCSIYFTKGVDFKHITELDQQNQLEMSLLYTQSTSDLSTILAVDSARHYVRRERIGHSVSVWDLESSLLYHVELDASADKYAPFKNKSDTDANQFDVNKCAVLSVADKSLPSHLRFPADASTLHPLELLIGKKSDSLFSAAKLNFAFMGWGYVRGLPCHIYESSSRRPPAIFTMSGSSSHIETIKPQVTKDSIVYITTFYLFENLATSQESTGGWWPARIVLHERSTKAESIVLWLDTIDIYDFSWSLAGWPTRPVDMFDAGECFKSGSLDRRSVELLLELQTKDSDDQETDGDEDAANLLAHSKFEIESKLQATVLETLGLRAQTMNNFKVNFRGSSHLIARFEIVNRHLGALLTFSGTGRIPDTEQGILLTSPLAADESSCVLDGALVDKVSLVSFCDQTPGVYNLPQCIIVVDNPESAFIIDGNDSDNVDDDTDTNYVNRQLTNTTVVKKTSTLVSNTDGCSIYRFTGGENDGGETSAVGKIMTSKDMLLNKIVTFGKSPYRKISAKIVDFEVQASVKLNRIGDYTFAASANDVKLLKRNVRGASGCASLCNLDPQCQSYSFCPPTDEAEFGCMLANVDIGNETSYSIREGKKWLLVKSDGKEYPIERDTKCSINERDYLFLYRVTNEFVKLQASEIAQHEKKSAFECARDASLLELESKDTHIAMFASCVRSSACILNETLIVGGLLTEPTQPSSTKNEHELCVVHRKKYQTYFHPSSAALPLVNNDNKNSQTKLKLHSVEECARACWIKLGDKCASFDHCTSSAYNDDVSDSFNCVVNSLSAKSAQDAGIELEVRDNCYHYERDLELDRLRKELEIGKQLVLDDDLVDKGNIKDSGIVFWVFALLLAPAGFVFGLWTGQRLNDRFWRRRAVPPSPSDNLGTSAADDELFDTDNIQMKPMGSSNRKDSMKEVLLDDS